MQPIPPVLYCHDCHGTANMPNRARTFKGKDRAKKYDKHRVNVHGKDPVYSKTYDKTPQTSHICPRCGSSFFTHTCGDICPRCGDP